MEIKVLRDSCDMVKEKKRLIKKTVNKSLYDDDDDEDDDDELHNRW